LEDVKLNLQETDYGNFLQNESQQASPSVIRDKALEKLVLEFEYLRSQAVGRLAKFLDFIVVDYMIDNVMLILKATLNNPNVNLEDLVAQRHPLGDFKPSTLKAICSFQNTSKGYADLYQTVLIDTPIGPYFQQFLKEISEVPGGGATGSGMGATDVRNVLEEMPTTKLENTLRKLYLEDFYNFCTKEIGGETGQLMGELLYARADAIAINITLNSFGSSLNDETGLADRALLYPSIGHLYPAGTKLLSEVRTEESLVEVLRGYKEYAAVLDKYVTGESTVDDAFYAREVMLCEAAFEGQFNYAPFYAYVRLKEQEIRNLVWACETIVQKQKSKMAQHFIPIFSRQAPWRSDGKKGPRA
jgi:V-type H+-transporting ATPase subunit d